MQYSEIFNENSHLLFQTELNKVYFHYFGEIKTLYDTIGNIKFAATKEGNPTFIYTIQAGGKIGDEYILPNLKNVQPVTKKEFQLYVQGVKK